MARFEGGVLDGQEREVQGFEVKVPVMTITTQVYAPRLLPNGDLDPNVFVYVREERDVSRKTR